VNLILAQIYVGPEVRSVSFPHVNKEELLFPLDALTSISTSSGGSSGFRGSTMRLPMNSPTRSRTTVSRAATLWHTPQAAVTLYTWKAICVTHIAHSVSDRRGNDVEIISRLAVFLHSVGNDESMIQNHPNIEYLLPTRGCQE
jgi:hypothetical protein